MVGNSRARFIRDGSFLLRLASALALLLALAGTSGAATFTVNSTADEVDANPGNGVCATAGGVCTLRAAVQEANADSPGPHTILIPAGTYTLTITGQGENASAMGDLDITANMTINGAGSGSTIIQAGTNASNGIDRLFEIRSGGAATIKNVTVRYGFPGGNDGGGFLVLGGLTLEDAIVTGNQARTGGGVFLNGAASSLTVRRTVFTGDVAQDGGGIAVKDGTLLVEDCNFSANQATRRGGGIHNDSGDSTVTGSTFSANSADTEDGGGILNRGGGAILFLANSTLSGNSAVRNGGGFSNESTATLQNVTITANAANNAGGGIRRQSGTVNVKNTIVANNTTGGNCSGTISSQGYNLDSANTCGFTAPGDRPNTNPILGPLQNNGGPTLTHALLPGSPAIDGGNSVGAPATDQRGIARPIDGDGVGGAAYDIGAYEAAYTAPLNDIAINGIFSDWCNGTGTEYCINDEGGPDDFTSPTKLDITRFGVASNLVSNLYLLVGFDDTSLSGATACVLFDTPTPVPNGRIDKVLCVDVSTSGVNSMRLYGCDDTLTQGCGNASQIKSYTSASWGFSNAAAGPWNTDTFVEMAVPWSDLGFSAGEVVLSGLVSYAGASFLTSPKDSIFGLTFENYDERIRYNTTTGAARREQIPPTPSVGGTVYTDEGVTNVGAGKTVRLIVNGSSAGTAVTDGGGSYFITTSAGAGAAILVYIDDDIVYQGTAVTVFNGATLSNLDIYAGHVITRHDNGSSLTNAHMSTAKGSYVDTDILYSVSGGALTVIGSGTKLFLPAGYGFSPGGNVTTPNLESRGTFAGGAGTIDANGDLTVSAGTFTATSGTTFVSGNLAVTSGIFTHNSGTVVLDGTNQAVSESIAFRNLTKSVASADTLTIGAGTTQTINGTATMNGAAGNLLRLRSASPGTRWNFRVNAGATKSISYVDVQDSDASLSDASKKPINPANSVDGGNTVDWFPAPRPDAMVKLSSEADAAYLTDNVYEAVATAQIKSRGVASGSTAAYNLKFQNDGGAPDSLVITGTGTGSGFTVQYLDDTATDRTAAVSGSGYTIAGLAAGASSVWTLNVVPSGNPTPVNGGTAYTVFVTAVSAIDNTKIDQVKTVTTSTSANLTILKSADKATVAPGEEIAYIVNVSNGSGLSAADNVVVNETIPANTGFKVGGASFNAGTSTLGLQSIGYFVTGPGWSYAPGSGACSAPAGYDYCVEQVRWTMTGTMPPGTGFNVGLVVRVK